MSLNLTLHILVVEDNDPLREATVDFLNDHGHYAEGLSCAEELADTPLQAVPDLYLIDVNLPGESGFELASRLRASQPLAGIVMMTARGQLEDRLNGYHQGADLYLVKPVEQAELLASIHNLGQRIKTTQTSSTTAPALIFYAQTERLEGVAGVSASLTTTESLLLIAFCRAAGQKLERWQVMHLVDPQDRGLTAANMEMRISALRKKLVQCGASEPTIQTLRGYGYKLSCVVVVH
ncbi:MAG: response regulator transcription factor [Comamonas sp.]|nr:response regulator transcription factor [Comamonas sp.]